MSGTLKRPRDMSESDEEEYDEYEEYELTCKRKKVVPLDFKSFVEEKRALEEERAIVRLSKQAAHRIIDRAIELAKPDFTVSSFGRIQRKKGGRHFQGTTASGYSIPVQLKKGEDVQVHALVHVLHNDPTLEGFKPGDTVNHRNHIRDDNDHTNHEWAGKSKQRLDQIRTTESKNRDEFSLADSQGTPVLVTTIADGTTVTYKDYGSAAAAAGVAGHNNIYNWCKHSDVVKGKRYEFAPQPDLVKSRAKTSIVGGRVKLVLTTQTESWKPVYNEDWLEGGKYFEVRGEKRGPMAERHTRREAKRAKLTAEAGPSSSAAAGPSDDSE